MSQKAELNKKKKFNLWYETERHNIRKLEYMFQWKKYGQRKLPSTKTKVHRHTQP